MKLRFLQKAPGRPEYQVGKIYDFDGPVAKTYADKYISREWAVEVVGGKKPDAADTGDGGPTAPADNGGNSGPGDAGGPSNQVDRGAITIAEGWADLPAADLRALADSVADAPTKNKAEAVAAIEAELARRAAEQP